MSPISLVTVLAPKRPGRWDHLREEWGWLTTPDERVLYAMLLAVALMGAWGIWAGWRGRQRPDQRQRQQK